MKFKMIYFVVFLFSVTVLSNDEKQNVLLDSETNYFTLNDSLLDEIAYNALDQMERNKLFNNEYFHKYIDSLITYHQETLQKNAISDNLLRLKIQNLRRNLKQSQRTIDSLNQEIIKRDKKLILLENDNNNPKKIIQNASLSFYTEALKYELNGDFKKALLFFTSAALGNQSSPLLTYKKASTLYKMREYEKSLQQLTPLFSNIDQLPPHLQIQVSCLNIALHGILNKSVDPSKVQRTIQKFDNNPNIPAIIRSEAHRFIAHFYMSQKKFQNARKHLQKGKLLLPTQTVPYHKVVMAIALTLDKEKKYKEAAIVYNEGVKSILAHTPDDTITLVSLHLNLTINALNSNDLVKAKKHIQSLEKYSSSIISKESPLISKSLLIKGQLAFKQKNYSLALKYGNEALKTTPHNIRSLPLLKSEILFLIGQTYHKQKRFSQAETYFQQAIEELSQTNNYLKKASYYNIRGINALYQNNSNNSIIYFEKSLLYIEKEKSDTTITIKKSVYKNLIHLYTLTGEHHLAKKYRTLMEE